MLYIKEIIKSEEVVFTDDNLECVGVKMTQSPQMSFIILVVYRPPTAKHTFTPRWQTL